MRGPPLPFLRTPHGTQKDPSPAAFQHHQPRNAQSILISQEKSAIKIEGALFKCWLKECLKIGNVKGVRFEGWLYSWAYL